MNNQLIIEELFNLMGYMLTSAKGLFSEPKEYGPLRLVEGVSRLCSILTAMDKDNRSFYLDLQAKIDESKFSVMSNKKEFERMLEHSVSKYTDKLKEQ